MNRATSGSRSWLLLLAVVVATVVTCGAAVLVVGPSWLDGEPDSAEVATEAARGFLDGYVDDDGRVVRRDQGDDTVSEGQAYAMLLAAAIDDEERFDRAWTWTIENLQLENGTLATLWDDGSVVDDDPASDAELDAIRALVLAAERFDEPDYREDAAELVEALDRHLVLEGPESVLLPGPWAAQPPVVLNPSYFAPRSFDAVATVDAELGEGLESSSRAATADLVAADRLPPDWALLDGDTAAASSAPSTPAEDPRYSYDAVRLPVRYAESCAADDRALAAELLPILVEAPASSVRALDGSVLSDERHPSALVGAAGAAEAAGDSQLADSLLDDAASLDDQQPTYYGSAWVALGRVMLQTDLLGAC